MSSASKKPQSSFGNSDSDQKPQNISAVPKKDENGRPIPGSCDGTCVRIRLFDDRERVLYFPGNPKPTAAQVCTQIGQKLDISGDALRMFSLWIVVSELELQIRPKMNLYEMVEKWPRWLEKYTHTTDDSDKSSGAYKFVFKREAMATKDQERQLTDETAIKLLYGEARNNIMNGRYPIHNSVEDAISLAALQMQVNYGDFNAAKHGPGTGFINQSISNIVPKNLLSKLKAQEWESKIANGWSQNTGKTGITPYRDFLEFARRWPHYGSTYFPACKNVPPSGYFELRTDHLWIAVNAEGLAIIDEDKHKVSWNGSYQGVEWECTPDSITIEFTPNAKPGAPPPKKMASTLITPQAHLVDSLASRAIYNIEKSDRRKKRMEMSTTNNGASSSAANTGAGPSGRRGSTLVGGPAEKALRPPSEGPRANPTIVENPAEQDYMNAMNQARVAAK